MIDDSRLAEMKGKLDRFLANPGGPTEIGRELYAEVVRLHASNSQLEAKIQQLEALNET